jgi:tRNA (guanine37-N1)-methyltransferase
MKVDVLTIFPEFVNSMADYGVVGRAIRNGILDFSAVNIRDFSDDKHHRVDDEPYGGGPGMLMTAQPIYDAIAAVKTPDARVLYLSPQGRVLDQEKILQLAKESHLVLLCGHYEGIDSRIVHACVDEEISIGDYVLTGGELPAMVLVDCVSRFVDGVLGDAQSPVTDSHYDGLLQHDVFTRPRIFRGMEVPEVLFSGNHAMIEAWKKENAIKNTMEKRPDLYEKFCAEEGDGNKR